MRLELEELSEFNKNIIKSKKEKEKEENSKKKKEDVVKVIEKFYEDKLSKIREEYEKKLEEVSRESYQQGFNDAKEFYEKMLKEEIEKLTKDFVREKKEEIESLCKGYEELEKKILEGYKDYIYKLTDIVLDSMEEILKFLYIDETNLYIVQKSLLDILDSFSNHLPVNITASKNLAKTLRKRFRDIEIKEDERLEENEFVVEFHDFKIENRIKDKLSVIKDEIKREIKKTTQI